MEKTIRELSRLFRDIEFKLFQNQFSRDVYESLSQSYKNKENEVSTVTRLVESINNKKYNSMKFHSYKIHGSRSYVEFDFQDRPTTKELADMIVISIISDGRKRLMQKVSFIQNKMNENGLWNIDKEQLYLLKNFPTFTGNKGLLKSYFGKSNICFHNHSKNLGSFMLFSDPGELKYISAPFLSEIVINGTIKLENINMSESIISNQNNGMLQPFIFDLRFYEEYMHYFLKRSGPYGFLPNLGMNNSLPFLTNSVFSRDVYDFVRNWTLFNLGETSFSYGEMIDENLDRFVVSILKKIGLNEEIDLPEGSFENGFNSDLAVFVVNFDVNQE